MNGIEGYEVKGADLYPAQETAVDIRLPAGAPRTRTSSTTSRSRSTPRRTSRTRPFPARAAEGAALGTMRNLRIGGVDVAGGQYQPQ